MGSGAGGPGWEVVEAKPEVEQKAEAPAVNAELRSYAEWFVWAKRAGADLSSSHAAAKAAVNAAASHQDPLVAAQGAVRSGTVTAVDQLHQEYTAWFAVASVDLGYDPPKSHAFAEAGVAALHEGKDVNAATAAAEAAAAAAATAVAAPVPVAEKIVEAAPVEPVAVEQAPIDPPPAPVETVAETIPPPSAPVETVAETIPPPGATAQLAAIPAADLVMPEPEPPAEPPPPVAPPAPAPKTAADAVDAATAFAGLGAITRSRAKLAATSELELASGIQAVPAGLTADRVWVAALLAGVTASGTALPETGCVVVMPVDLGQFWHLQAGARQGWPDWFERLPDHSGE